MDLHLALTVVRRERRGKPGVRPPKLVFHITDIAADPDGNRIQLSSRPLAMGA